ncbi:methyltransferase type 12 [Stanieria cyanosphaera PCC 7437]|uniref:Methyltransferase type 12 n=1 Tax=Stanieria cyanosphaera (strain ATCC 29371 / PCC 7437) TaxID=111780 RepID=K9XR73_STAC7|nr:methyltransferase domain-containing protein [Stanieria cyanosphaera]AFZ34574.1 methyltransferase type 12 [Stanieria cyanosphaera PCC 7437]
MSYSLVQGQQFMALDLRRNQAYWEALKQVITPESVVLDLGAGLGTLGLLAAQLGAKKVYLIEPEDVINVAGEIAKANGYDNVVCLQGKIEEVQLPEAVDVIISVFTGNFLLQEDLLPSLFYARDKYLKPNGVMIPQAAVMEAVPASIPDFYQKNIACWSEIHLGINLSVARSYVSNSIYYSQKELSNAQYLAQPTKLLAMDFHSCNNTNCEIEITQTIIESGCCHGWIGWFAMQLGDKWLSTAPHEPHLHWSAAFLPLDPPLELEAGEEVKFKLQRPAFGDWSWKVKTDTTSQQHSTFFALPMTLKKMKKFSPQYQPSLNDKGKAARYVLSNIDGKLSVEQLTIQLTKDYPQLFKESKKALNFVRNLIAGFS